MQWRNKYSRFLGLEFTQYKYEVSNANKKLHREKFDLKRFLRIVTHLKLTSTACFCAWYPARAVGNPNEQMADISRHCSVYNASLYD